VRPELSVVLPAHDPRLDVLTRALEGLRGQSLDSRRWELIVVDNRSTPPLASVLDLAWHPAARIVREETLGLTAARCAGFRAAAGELIVLVDDDNVLAPDYLARALDIAAREPRLGSWSGHQEPIYERPGFSLPAHLEPLVGGRRVARACWSNDIAHHASTPWGAGMCLRRAVAEAYLERLENDPRRRRLDVVGARRQYGGDTDIAYVGCEVGYGKGVFPELRLEHLVAASRCGEDYLARASEGHAYSSMLHRYVLEGVAPEPRGGHLRWLFDRLRRLRLSPLERRLAAARDAGIERARRELDELRSGGAT